MTNKATYKCKSCKRDFTARTADRARGWALFCSKSCKAICQTQNQIKAAKKSRPWQRYDKCATHEDRLDLLRNPRVIEPLYDEYGERDGELFFANFSNEEGCDI